MSKPDVSRENFAGQQDCRHQPVPVRCKEPGVSPAAGVLSSGRRCSEEQCREITLGKLGVAFTILNVLDCRPQETNTLRAAVGKIEGLHAVSVYFEQMLSGLQERGYVRFEGGPWRVTGHRFH